MTKIPEAPILCVGALLATAVLAPAASAQGADGPAGPGSSADGGAGPDAAAWLAGCWVARSGSSRTDEVWMAPEGGLMVGMSRTVRDGRARGWELLLLATREGVLTYSAHPSGQALAHFAATEITPGTLRFENPDHDFPKAIEYRRPASDSLLARVFGEVDAPEPAFVVRYGRGPCPGG